MLYTFYIMYKYKNLYFYFKKIFQGSSYFGVIFQENIQILYYKLKIYRKKLDNDLLNIFLKMQVKLK